MDCMNCLKATLFLTEFVVIFYNLAPRINIGTKHALNATSTQQTEIIEK